MKNTDAITFTIKPEGLMLLRQTLKTMELKHGPFNKWYRGYTVDIWPSANLTFFILKMNDYIVK